MGWKGKEEERKKKDRTRITATTGSYIEIITGLFSSANSLHCSVETLSALVLVVSPCYGLEGTRQVGRATPLHDISNVVTFSLRDRLSRS